MHSVSGGPGRPPALIQEAVYQLGPCAVEFLWKSRWSRLTQEPLPEYTEHWIFPSSSSSLELLCHHGRVTILIKHPDIQQEQCSEKTISYVSQVLALPRVHSSPWIQSSVTKILHLCEMFFSCFKLLLNLETTSSFFPCFEKCSWMFSLDSKWLRWSTRCLGNFQNEWSLPQENHIKLKTVREQDWLIIWVDLVWTNFLWKEMWEQKPH